MEKICPECGGRFVGRLDKIYCCDSCRANHNNRIYRRRDRDNRLVNRILLNNRNLLQSTLLQGRSSASLKALRELGFNPGFWTSRQRRTVLPNRYSCYEFSYTLLPRRIVNIKRIFIAKNG